MQISGFYLLQLSCLVILFIYGSARISYRIWWRPRSLQRRLLQQGISGTSYKLLVGDMKQYIESVRQVWSKPLGLHHRIVDRVDPFTHTNVRKYGKISFLWSGKTPRMIITDPELMKEVLSNKLGNFSKPPLSPQILVLTRGLTTLQGKDWATHRTILNPAFHLQKLKEMIPVFAASCRVMIEEWKNKFGLEESCELDVWPELQKLTADVISRAAFGSSYEEGKKIFELQRELTGLVLESMQTLHIPGFRFVPTKKNRRRKKLNEEITSMLRRIVQKKENTIKNGETKGDNLLGLLLQSNGEASLFGNESRWMTMEEIIEECKQFYLAGQETTASVLTWVVIVLAMHPDWQEKAREEVQAVCNKKELDFEAISHLKTVTMILYEVLMLYPPVIAQYQHAYRETKIGEFMIPAGTDVVLPTLLIHHDAELCGDVAEEFKPEQFGGGVSRASSGDNPKFFPFGWGPRICIGQNFTMLEAKVAMVSILQSFSFALSPAYSHAPYTVMTLQPQHGSQIILMQSLSGRSR